MHAVAPESPAPPVALDRIHSAVLTHRRVDLPGVASRVRHLRRGHVVDASVARISPIAWGAAVVPDPVGRHAAVCAGQPPIPRRAIVTARQTRIPRHNAPVAAASPAPADTKIRRCTGRIARPRRCPGTVCRQGRIPKPRGTATSICSLNRAAASPASASLMTCGP